MAVVPRPHLPPERFVVGSGGSADECGNRAGILYHAIAPGASDESADGR
jgi:hypothetical protein